MFGNQTYRNRKAMCDTFLNAVVVTFFAANLGVPKDACEVLENLCEEAYYRVLGQGADPDRVAEAYFAVLDSAKEDLDSLLSNATTDIGREFVADYFLDRLKDLEMASKRTGEFKEYCKAIHQMRTE